jgi:G3E family GTPase
LVNDYGDIGIDRDLVSRSSGDVVDLPGGCVCCNIRGDLLEAVRRLLLANRKFEYLIVEASGVADPRPIVQTFLSPEVERRLRLDAVIAVVDVDNIRQCAESQPTAVAQIHYSDVVILNKVDLVPPGEVAETIEWLSRVNEFAAVIRAERCDVPISVVLDVAQEPTRTPNKSPTPLGATRHDDLVAASYRGASPVDFARFQRFLEALPADVIRAKGIMHVSGVRQPVVFHRVGRRNVLDQLPSWPGPERSSRAVFLGYEFCADDVLRDIVACET